MNKIAIQIANEINFADNILLLGHLSPDGDCIGSICALTLALRAAGKNAYFALNSPIPKRYAMIAEMSEYYLWDTVSRKGHDIVVAIDVADRERLGAIPKQLFGNAPISVCIDHHLTNDGFGDLNWIEGKAAAAMLVFELIKYMKLPINGQVADCLYIALATDTGSFSYSNTDSESLEVAAELVGQFGAEVAEISERVFSTVTLGHLKLLSRAVENLEIVGEVGITYLTNFDFEELEAEKDDCESIVERIRDIDEIETAILLRQMNKGGYKVSTRSKTRDVAAFCAKFGGGGHIRAAGCIIEDDLESVKSRISEALWTE